MSRYRIIWVGRQAHDPLLTAADAYFKRLQHYARVDVQCVREGTVEGEARAILQHIEPNAYVIAMDVLGDPCSSTELANYVRRWQAGQDDASKSKVFIIGGAEGLHATIKKRAQRLWSMSKFTLPHRLALVVLAEQLYRAHTIVRGEPYHK